MWSLEKSRITTTACAGPPVKDPFIPGTGRALPGNYRDCLNINGVMCTIDIPSIGVNLPVYHGVSDEVLNKGIGHTEGTALPIGGPGGHTVLTGHTGLSSAKLFTDLVELKEGTGFISMCLGGNLCTASTRSV